MSAPPGQTIVPDSGSTATVRNIAGSARMQSKTGPRKKGARSISRVVPSVNASRTHKSCVASTPRTRPGRVIVVLRLPDFVCPAARQPLCSQANGPIGTIIGSAAHEQYGFAYWEHGRGLQGKPLRSQRPGGPGHRRQQGAGQGDG